MREVCFQSFRVRRVDGAGQVVPERRERADAAVVAGGGGVAAPDADLAVLVAGEDAAVGGGDDDGLDEAAAGAERGELAAVAPDADGVRVGPKPKGRGGGSSSRRGARSVGMCKLRLARLACEVGE